MNSTITLTETKNKNLIPSWIRIGLAWTACLIAIGFSGWIGEYAVDQGILTNSTRFLLQAFIMSSIVLTSIVLLRKKWAQGSPASIGIGTFRDGFVKFLTGIGIIAIPIILSILATVLFGWGKVQFNVGDGFFTTFMLGAMTTFLFEALPEELVFRGYIYAHLNGVYKRWISSLLTIALFVFLPIVLVYIQKNLLGMEIYVGGNSHITASYLIIMLLFGSFLQYVRIITGSIWTGVGFHLFFVYLNHMIGPTSKSIIQFTEFTNETPVQLVFGASLLVIFALLLLYPRISKRKIGWNVITGKDA